MARTGRSKGTPYGDTRVMKGTKDMGKHLTIGKQGGKRKGNPKHNSSHA